MTEKNTVRDVIGSNVERVRRRRGLTVRDMSARLKDVGLSLSASGISDIENAGRKVSADELLIIAIALNCCVIDLFVPQSGEPLKLTESIEPIPPAAVEEWLSGNAPWPPGADFEEFFETASVERRLRERNWQRPEMIELAVLQSAVLGAIEGVGPLNEVEDPKEMADYLRQRIERLSQYVGLLADHLEKNGYGPAR